MNPSHRSIHSIISESKGINGVTLFDHLIALFERITKVKDDLSTYDRFEILSDLVKKTYFVNKEATIDSELKTKPDSGGPMTSYINNSAKLLSPILSGPQSNPKPITTCGHVQNVFEDFKMLRMAGIDFGESEVFKLSKAMQRLSYENSASEVRFWGKILGSQKDYYVVEGVSTKFYNDEVPLEYEKAGKGVNSITYWVANDLLSEWYELPMISPEHIKLARSIKYIFTGEINHKVDVYPKFPFYEKHMLKAQIVRISHSTVLSPKGVFKTNDEDDKIIEFEEEEFKMPEYAELSNLENWVHLRPYLLKEGRVEYYIDMSLPEEERETKLEAKKDLDPEIPRIRAINEDERITLRITIAYPGYETAWNVRSYGDPQIFNMVDADDGKACCYGVVALKSLYWPGATIISQGESYSNIYIGYGHKNGQLPFFPSAPNDLMEDQDDIEEHFEPNPKNPIEVLEPDSDHEKADGDGEEEED